jgi:lysophospholipase L1-like esterase
LPFGGGSRYTAAREATRQLRPAYNSGDFIHPNDAGYQAMANAVSLGAL